MRERSDIKAPRGSLMCSGRLMVCVSSFLTALPRVLAEVYHSLGSQLPDALLALLPADFFSDESVCKDSVSPSAPRSLSSLGSDGGHQLHTLRDRSANQRRWGGQLISQEGGPGSSEMKMFLSLPHRSGVLTRHRSMTESSQSLRQIEMPKKTTRAVRARWGCGGGEA